MLEEGTGNPRWRHRQPTLEEKELEIHILITHLAEPNPNPEDREA